MQPLHVGEVRHNDDLFVDEHELKRGALRDRILATLAEGDEGEAELVATKDRLEARITEIGAEAKRLLGGVKGERRRWEGLRAEVAPAMPNER